MINQIIYLPTIMCNIGGHAEGYPDTFTQAFKQIYRAVRNGKRAAGDIFATFSDGHYEMVLSQAIQLSAAENRWVEISEVDGWKEDHE